MHNDDDLLCITALASLEAGDDADPSSLPCECAHYLAQQGYALDAAITKGCALDQPDAAETN